MTKTTRRPVARRRATASTEPGIGRWASQITPSRSQITTAGSTIRQRTGPVLRPACQPGRVPRFEPFPALRYSPTVDLAAVVAPPYDVLSDDDVSALAARDEHNIVHVDVPRDPDRYAAAARLLRHWIAEGILVADEAPTFTLYRMRFTDASGRRRDLVGAVGALEVVDDGAGGVLPHERTTPKASTDRLDLTRATRANISPVWGLSLASGLTELLAEPGELVGSVTVDGGRARRRAGGRPRPDRRHQRQGRGRRGAHRRRPSPLRREPHLPRRDPRRDRARRTRRPSRRWRSSASSPLTS